jgi:hypothetical protein
MFKLWVCFGVWVGGVENHTRLLISLTPTDTWLALLQRFNHTHAKPTSNTIFFIG